MLKTGLLSILAVIISLSVFGQDKIYKTEGSVIDAKVKSVGTNAIIFKRSNNVEGPEYTISKKEVIKIVYQNGLTDFFSKGDAEDGHNTPGDKKKIVKKYGNNFISLTPAAYTVSVDGTMNDVGVGLTYERLVDKHGHLGINVPVMWNFTAEKDFRGRIYYNGSNYTNYPGNYHTLLFMPGVKFYPANANQIIRYSLGTSLFAAVGTEPYDVYNYNNYYSGSSPSSDTYHYTIFGVMISNSLNITATKHLYMAIDLTAGIPFSDNRHSSSDQLELLLAPFMQFGFKVGYRY